MCIKCKVIRILYERVSRLMFVIHGGAAVPLLFEMYFIICRLCWTHSKIVSVVHCVKKQKTKMMQLAAAEHKYNTNLVFLF